MGYPAGVKPFASRIIAWQKTHGRHQLPWQGSTDPYRIWLSEIMLQQTQVATVIPYYERFLTRFPSLSCLAAAHLDEVLTAWSGLGYYSRARNLHAAAQQITTCLAGKFPDASLAIAELPGIGRSTAAAIAALAFGERCAILDGNVKRVLARHGGISGWPGDKKTERSLWLLAESVLPSQSIEDYTQGMMDLGALICTRSMPSCGLCPVSQDCIAKHTHRTAELPTPRPKKILPERHIQMLLVLDRGELLLEKRPARGIWGGMLSLPELAVDADPAAYSREHLRLSGLSLRKLPQLTHTFTHFKLHIQPIQHFVAPRTHNLPGQIWLPLAEAMSAALPAPIRTLASWLDLAEQSSA